MFKGHPARQTRVVMKTFCWGLLLVASCLAPLTGRAQLIHFSAEGVITSKYWGYNWGSSSHVGDLFQIDLYFGRPEPEQNLWRLRFGLVDLSGPMTEVNLWDRKNLNLLYRDQSASFVLVFAAEFAEPWKGERGPVPPLPPLFGSSTVYLDYFSRLTDPDVPPGEIVVAAVSQGAMFGHASFLRAEQVRSFGPVPESSLYGWAALGLLASVTMWRRWRRPIASCDQPPLPFRPLPP